MPKEEFRPCLVSGITATSPNYLYIETSAFTLRHTCNICADTRQPDESHHMKHAQKLLTYYSDFPWTPRRGLARRVAGDVETVDPLARLIGDRLARFTSPVAAARFTAGDPCPSTLLASPSASSTAAKVSCTAFITCFHAHNGPLTCNTSMTTVHALPDDVVKSVGPLML